MISVYENDVVIDTKTLEEDYVEKYNRHPVNVKSRRYALIELPPAKPEDSAVLMSVNKDNSVDFLIQRECKKCIASKRRLRLVSYTLGVAAIAYVSVTAWIIGWNEISNESIILSGSAQVLVVKKFHRFHLGVIQYDKVPHVTGSYKLIDFRYSRKTVSDKAIVRNGRVWIPIEAEMNASIEVPESPESKK